MQRAMSSKELRIWGKGNVKVRKREKMSPGQWGGGVGGDAGQRES